MSEAKMVPLESYREYPPAEMEGRASAFYEEMKRRRSGNFMSGGRQKSGWKR